MNKRTIKEISNAQKSDLYKFIINEKEEGTSYTIKFTVKEGQYKGQTHLLDIKFSYSNKSYPEYPPMLTFITSILHANVSSKGIICVDTLKDRWSPMMGIDSIFNMIICLLDDPNPNSPMNYEGAKILDLPLDQRSEIIKKDYETKNAGIQHLLLDDTSENKD
jgi:ubiquitin-protein ligase